MQDLPYIVEVTQATVTCEMHLWNGSTMNIDNFTTTTFNIRALPLLINTIIIVEECCDKKTHLIHGIHPKHLYWAESLPTIESLHRNGCKIRDTFEFMLNIQWILHLQQQQMNNSNNRSTCPSRISLSFCLTPLHPIHRRYPHSHPTTKAKIPFQFPRILSQSPMARTLHPSRIIDPLC